MPEQDICIQAASLGLLVVGMVAALVIMVSKSTASSFDRRSDQGGLAWFFGMHLFLLAFTIRAYKHMQEEKNARKGYSPIPFNQA